MLMVHLYVVPTSALSNFTVTFVSAAPCLKAIGDIVKISLFSESTLNGTMMASSVLFLATLNVTLVSAFGSTSTVVETVCSGKYTPKLSGFSFSPGTYEASSAQFVNANAANVRSSICLIVFISFIDYELITRFYFQSGTTCDGSGLF